MTYSNGKIQVDNQALANSRAIEQGLQAAHQQNWLLVIHYLQQLSLDKKTSSSIRLSRTIWRQGFQLALSVLFSGDFQQRWEVAKIIPRLGKEVIHPLIIVLEDEAVDIEVRWFISRILGEFTDPHIIITLVKLLQQTEHEELILVAVQTLAQIGTKAIDALSELLTQEEYRLLSVQALAHIRSIETINPLLTVAKDSQPEVRAIAIEALGSFHDRRITPILLEALQDTSAKVRKEAVIALGFRRDLAHKLNLVECIKPLLYDLDLEVCRQAAISLSRMGSEEAATTLFKVLSSSATPPILKLDLVRALSWNGTELALNYLQQSLQMEQEQICQEIVAVLGRVIEPQLKVQAVQILIDFWHSAKGQSSQSRLKQNLATAFCILGDTKAVDSLQQLAKEPEESIKLHAIAALKKARNYTIVIYIDIFLITFNPLSAIAVNCSRINNCS